jgi:hypothetical protein
LVSMDFPMIINFSLLSLSLYSCTDTDGVTTEDYVPPEELPLPDLSDVDIKGAFELALQRVTEIQLTPAWNGNREVLDLRFNGCPDLYVGAPEEVDMDDAPGVSWSDFCTTPGGLGYGGFAYWDSSVTQQGSPSSVAGYLLEGQREMIGQGIVNANGETKFEFKGTASDSFYFVEDPPIADQDPYNRWIYSSLVEGTISGTLATGSGNGYRTDLYMRVTGGDVDSLEARGNVYWFNSLINERFDSAGMDLVLVGENGAGPDDCTLEPKGWLGIRDENAYWYDLVFMPKDAEDSTGYLDEEHSTCDGCGILYLRGVETENYGKICPDFSGLWSGDNSIDLPVATDFLLTLQQLEGVQ